MAVFNLTAAQPLMKIMFNPRISKQFNSAAVLWNRYADGKGIPISNRGMEIPTHLQPNAVFNWFADGGTLPAGGSEALTSALVGFFSFVLPVQLTGAALDAAGNDATTYARALAFNIKMATINAIKYLNIYAFLDGTGILALAGAGATLSTTVNTTINVTGSIEAAHYLRPGMNINFLTGSALSAKASATIISLDQPIEVANGTNIVVGPATSAATINTNDAIVVTGSPTVNSADSFQNVLSGLKLIVDNGTVTPTFQNINRSTNNQYNAGVIALSGSPALARDHLRRALATVQYTDAFVAFLLFRGNLGTYVPNAHVKINGLGVPTGY